MSDTPIPASSVREYLQRIMASVPFATADRSRALLTFVVEQTLAGSADRLKEYTLATEALGRPTSFDPRIDPIVRAEISRLRTRLENYYAAEGRSDAVEILLPRGTYVPQFQLRKEKEFVAAVEPPAPVAPAPRSRRLLWIASAAAACAASFFIGSHIRDRHAPEAPWKLRQLTDSAGRSESSAISRDGKLVAYSAEIDGQRDLYVKQVDGGQPIRLTTDGKGNTSPDFSPDGTQIIFHSQRDGGGVYEIPAFGGEARLIAKSGLNPRYSPDGTKVAYWIGDPTVAPAVPGAGEVWVAPTSGGSPQRVGLQFTNARNPLWSPDGRHLLLIGYTSKKVGDSSAIDWWLVSTSDNVTVRSGVFQAISEAGFRLHDAPSSAPLTYPNVPIPGCWLSPNRVIFSIHSGDTHAIWETGIAQATGKVDGSFKRITAGGSNDEEPSCSSPAMLTFTNANNRRSLSSIAFDSNVGKASGELEELVQDSSAEEPSLSTTGRFLAFATSRSGPLNIWRRDLQTGQDVHLAIAPNAQRFPVINAEGNKILFSENEPGGRNLYIFTIGGGKEKICETCLRATSWSKDERSVLTFGGVPYQIDLLDIATHQLTPLLKHPTYSLLFGRFSPDGQWINFTARTGANAATIYIAPLEGKNLVPESRWIKVSVEGPDDRASWSQDGKTIYIASNRDGHSCIWGQHFDPQTHRLVGDQFAAMHLHGRFTYNPAGLAIEGGRLVAGFDSGSSNIWMMSRTESH